MKSYFDGGSNLVKASKWFYTRPFNVKIEAEA
jgi:hypothetical protein